MTGRCYCGRTRFTATARPQTVTYCHCLDCRRLSGAPVAAFAAFAPGEVALSPSPKLGVQVTKGVERWFCSACGTQLRATYDYLPDQVYVPLGIIDQASDLPPEGHSFAGGVLPWLHIEDDLPRDADAGADRLLGKSSDL